MSDKLVATSHFRDERTTLGLSQKKLEELSKVSRQTIYVLETRGEGVTRPTARALYEGLRLGVEIKRKSEDSDYQLRSFDELFRPFEAQEALLDGQQPTLAQDIGRGVPDDAQSNVDLPQPISHQENAPSDHDSNMPVKVEPTDERDRVLPLASMLVGVSRRICSKRIGRLLFVIVAIATLKITYDSQQPTSQNTALQMPSENGVDTSESPKLVETDLTQEFLDQLRRKVIGNQLRQTNTRWRQNGHPVGHETMVRGMVEATNINIPAGRVYRVHHPSLTIPDVGRTNDFDEVHAVLTIDVTFEGTTTAKRRLVFSSGIVQAVGLGSFDSKGVDNEDKKDGFKMGFGKAWDETTVGGIVSFDIEYHTVGDQETLAKVTLAKKKMNDADRPHQFASEVFVERHLVPLVIQEVPHVLENLGDF